jgi:hypothetical protein
VSLSKTGQGTIVSTPAGISCAVSGAPACGGTSYCSFNASATRVLVTATFTQ